MGYFCPKADLHNLACLPQFSSSSESPFYTHLLSLKSIKLQGNSYSETQAFGHWLSGAN